MTSIETKEASSERYQKNYDNLTPDTIIAAVESLGLYSDTRILALNSYENRVYQVGLEEQSPIIAKFYRPWRWSDEQILEEHHFTQTLNDLDIPVTPPLIVNEQTLFEHEGFRFALYPRVAGQAPSLDNHAHLEMIGRFIGRIHGLGKQQTFSHRATMTIDGYGHQSRAFLLDNDVVLPELRTAYETVTADVLQQVERQFKQCSYQNIRLHGDCHHGNILWQDDCAHFVDFDDALNGPAIQDLWMMLSGDDNSRQLQLASILKGYSEFCDFNAMELNLIESLRTLRLMHYSAWLARRWHDPAFPRHFPWFNTERYWAEHVLALREQMAAMQEPALRWL